MVRQKSFFLLMARLTESITHMRIIIINNWMLPETGLLCPFRVGNRRKEQRPGWGIRPLSGRSLGGRDPGYIPRLKAKELRQTVSGRRQRNGWRWHAQIGRHRHDGGIAVGQASSGSCIRSA